MRRATIISLLLAGASCLAGVAAHAETDAETADTIVVTGLRTGSEAGTKTDTPLIETPQAISVVTADRFLAMGALNLQDTLRYVSGVRTESYGLDTRGDYGYIRSTEPAVFQDGMRRLYGGYRTGSKQEIFTLERVEVIRGPSSMLYGQGAVGGLINTVSKRPQFAFGGEIFGSYGNHDRQEIGVDVTGPIAGDTLAGRIVGVWRDSDSQTDFVGERRWTINPSLTWAPSADTSLTLLGLIQDDNSGWTGQFLPYAATLLAPPGRRVPWGRQAGEPSVDKVDLNTRNATLLFSHRFSEHLQFRQNARLKWFTSDQALHYPDSYVNPTDPFVPASDPYLNLFFPALAAAGDGRIVNRYFFAELFKSRTLTSDTQLQFDFATGPFAHKLLVGVDYSNNRGRSRSAFGYSANGFFDDDGDPATPDVAIPPSTTPIDLYDPMFGNVIPFTYAPDPRTRETQFGVYLQDQITAFERGTIVLGLRRDRAISRVEGGGEQNDTAWTTRVGFMYALGGGITPYVSYSESFQPLSGVDLNTGLPYHPQRGRQYEAGVKWQPDARTFVTATAYDLRDSGRLTSDPTNPLNSIQAGVVRTRGIELEGQRSVADNFDVIAAYSYTRAKDKAITVGGAITIDQFESIPKHLASLWGVKSVAVAEDSWLRIGGGVRYVGKSYSISFDGAGTSFTLATPGYVAVDALIGFDRGPWRLSVNATNLFDKKYYATCLGRGDCFLGLRRTVNGTIAYRF